MKDFNRLVFASALLISVTTACSGSKKAETETMTVTSSPITSNSPFVEAYLEYVGPPAKWAGPRTVLIHMIAKDMSRAEVQMRPDLFTEALTRTQEAGVTAKVSTLAGALQPSGQMAREKISHLAESILADKSDFVGCLYPVRARLVRADGTLVEKFGCRNIQGWTSVASRTVSHMLTVAVQEKLSPMDTNPARKTASGN